MLPLGWSRNPFPIFAWTGTFVLALSMLLSPRLFYDWMRNRNPEFRSIAQELAYRNIRLLGVLFLAAAIFFCIVWLHNNLR